LGVDSRKFLAIKEEKVYLYEEPCNKIVVYTGASDELLECKYGVLPYRSLRFEEEELPDCDNYQGNSVVNYTEREVPYTRIIEHKHFEFGKGDGTYK